MGESVDERLCPRAAHAAMCAQEQHKYWEVREMLLQIPLDWREEHKNGSVFNAPTLRRGHGSTDSPPPHQPAE